MWLKKVDKFIAKSSWFKHVYVIFAVTVLGVTTLWWSWLGARVQQGNADQLVDGFLFESSRTFHGAYFPGSHTFLLKWPLFYLLKLLNYSSAAYIGLTILVCLLTVGAFVYLLSRLEKRPLVFGNLCLLLAAVLFTIPAKVHPGSTSPFNMAMLTTRNLEYIIYLGCLVLFLKAKTFRSWQWITGITMLVLLIASDRLFAGLSIGGSVIGLLFFSGIYYFKHQKRGEVMIMARWLIASIVAFFGASIVLWFLNHFTHIVNDGSNIYGFSHTWRAFAQGSWQAIVRLINNFGPNLFMAIIILLMVAFAAYQITNNVINVKNKKPIDQGQLLSIMLLTSTITALILFAGTQQPYQLDARYLTIGIFSGFVMLAVYIHSKQPRQSLVVLTGLLAVIIILISIPSALKTSAASKNFDNVEARNQAIAAALKKHPVNVLIGNYWRVIPIKSLSNQQRVAPLINCVNLRGTLTSRVWRPQLPNDSFAYLLPVTPDGGSSGCYQAEIIRRFGRPLSTKNIGGTKQRPEDILLFYNFDQRAPQRNVNTLPFVR